MTAPTTPALLSGPLPAATLQASSNTSGGIINDFEYHGVRGYFPAK